MSPPRSMELRAPPTYMATFQPVSVDLCACGPSVVVTVIVGKSEAAVTSPAQLQRVRIVPAAHADLRMMNAASPLPGADGAVARHISNGWSPLTQRSMALPAFVARR